MTINTENYFDLIKEVDWTTLPEVLFASHQYVVDATENGTNWKPYLVDEDIKDAIDIFLLTLNKLVKLPEKETPKGTKPGEKPKDKKTSKKPSSKKADPQKSSPEFVRELDLELRLIKRFKNLHGKEKSYKQVLGVLQAINRAIEKGLIRKSKKPTPYHKQIQKMQDALLGVLGTDFRGLEEDEKTEVDFGDAFVESLVAIINKYQVWPSVRFALRFIGMEGKAPDHEKVNSLLKAIATSKEKGKIGSKDPNAGFLVKVNKSLQDYLDGKDKTVTIHPTTLNGICGVVAGCDCEKVPSYELVDRGSFSSTDQSRFPNPEPVLSGYEEEAFLIPPPQAHAVSFASNAIPYNPNENLKLKGRWESLFNEPVKGFSAIIYGKPKSGKSTLALDFGGYLARNHGKVLYASIEEGVRGTIRERLSRLHASHPNMEVTNNLPKDLSPYKFVFIDSASRGRMDIKLMRYLIAQWPEISFLFIFHVTKSGTTRGTLEYQHEVDVLVEVSQGRATAMGRFDPGEMNVRYS